MPLTRDLTCSEGGGRLLLGCSVDCREVGQLNGQSV